MLQTCSLNLFWHNWSKKWLIFQSLMFVEKLGDFALKLTIITILEKVQTLILEHSYWEGMDRGDNRVTGLERGGGPGGVITPKFSILASTCGWGEVKFFPRGDYSHPLNQRTFNNYLLEQMILALRVSIEAPWTDLRHFIRVSIKMFAF